MADIHLVPEPPAPTPENEALRFRTAYHLILPEIRAVPDEWLKPISLDIPSLVIKLLGLIGGIRALREALAKLPHFDAEAFDKFEQYVLALGHAQVQFLAASQPLQALPELMDEATTLRERVLADCTALAKRGLIDGTRLQELKGPVGYKNTAMDLLLLAEVIRANLNAIMGKSAVTLAELDRAEILADRIMVTVGEREQGPAVAAQSADNRMRAYALVHRVYDQIQRGVEYERRPFGDAELITPSFFAGRGTGTRKKAEDDQAGDTHVPTTPGTPTPGAPTHGTTAPGVPANKTPAAPVAVGLPGSDPFGRV